MITKPQSVRTGGVYEVRCLIDTPYIVRTAPARLGAPYGKRTIVQSSYIVQASPQHQQRFVGPLPTGGDEPNSLVNVEKGMAWWRKHKAQTQTKTEAA
jgi:hypothetical protein